MLRIAKPNADQLQPYLIHVKTGKVTSNGMVKGLDSQTMANNRKANDRLKQQAETVRLERRKRMSLAESLYLAQTKKEMVKKVQTLKPIQSEPVKQAKVNTSPQYVFRDRITGKVLNRMQVGHLPHLYR